MEAATEDFVAPKETRISIEGIMGKDSLTMLDLGRLFAYLSDVIDKMPNALLSVSEDAKVDAERTVMSAKATINTVHGYLDEMEKVENAILDRYDTAYKNFTKKREEISVALEKLPASYYLADLERLMDLSEKLAQMPTETFDRVLALAAAMPHREG